MNPSEFSPPRRMDRRAAIKWMLTAAASAALLDLNAPAAAAPAKPGATGYGQDPDLLKSYAPGEVWPLTFTNEQRRTAGTLCDVIIPADAGSPAASTLGVADFIDEWISAPYPDHDIDRRAIIEGLAWLDVESQRRFHNPFTALTASQRNEICEDICLVATARPEFKTPAQFFRRYRDLTAGGFYTTPAGMKDIGYVGNVPLASFDGPPPGVLNKLGLA